MRPDHRLLGILLFVAACDGPLANPSPVHDPLMHSAADAEPARFVRYDEMEPARAAAIRKGVAHAAARSPARTQPTLPPVRYGVSVQPLERHSVAIVLRDAAGAMIILTPAADDRALALADAALARDVAREPRLAIRRVMAVDRNGIVHDLSTDTFTQVDLRMPGEARSILTAPMITRARSRPAQMVPGVGAVKFID
jgi:hypothetical protein